MLERVLTWLRRWRRPTPAAPFEYWPASRLGDPETPTQVLAYLCHREKATHKVELTATSFRVGLTFPTGRTLWGEGKDVAQAVRDLCNRVGYAWKQRQEPA